MKSPLRQQLQTAKAEYDQLRYPGNLAAEVLQASPRKQGRWIIAALGAVAVAAVVTVLVMIQPDVTKPAPGGSNDPTFAGLVEPRPIDTASDDSIIQISLAELPLVEAPRGSDEMDMAPVAPSFNISSSPDFSFSAPSITFIANEDDAQPETSTPTGAINEPSTHA